MRDTRENNTVDSFDANQQCTFIGLGAESADTSVESSGVWHILQPQLLLYSNR